MKEIELQQSLWNNLAAMAEVDRLFHKVGLAKLAPTRIADQDTGKIKPGKH